jgi:hypothetical protein
VHLWLADPDVATRHGLIEQAPDPQARGAHQPPEVRQVLDRA